MSDAVILHRLIRIHAYMHIWKDVGFNTRVRITHASVVCSEGHLLGCYSKLSANYWYTGSIGEPTYFSFTIIIDPI